MTAFHTLDLSAAVLTGVERLGYAAMTDIQAEALPLALSGRDLVAHARTGSGKTTIFGLTLLQRLDVAERAPQALVLCPTRELAAQVVDALRSLAVGLDGVRVLAVTGGASSRDQRDALDAGAHVIVGSPGRVLRQLELQRIDVARITTLVLDEADRLLDMGFEDQVHDIVRRLPRARQTLLFTATWQPSMEALSAWVQRDPVTVKGETLVDTAQLTQTAVVCGWDERDAVLRSILRHREPTPTLAFCETRSDCDRVAHMLTAHGATAHPLHGELEQRDRDDVLAQLRNGSLSVLVATNVAARGLDIDGVGLVVCYELSADPSLHVHRVGRTARSEALGEAVSIVAGGGKQVRALDAIEGVLGASIPRETWSPEPDAPLDAWQAPWRTLLVLGGRREGLRAGDVLGALTRGVGLEGSDVGTIALTDRRVWVAVRAEVATRARDGLNRERIKKKRFRVHQLGAP